MIYAVILLLLVPASLLLLALVSVVAVAGYALGHMLLTALAARGPQRAPAPAAENRLARRIEAPSH